ncbi:MAG: DUF6600 domain-containing protein [Limisphaerales bacterium]
MEDTMRKRYTIMAARGERAPSRNPILITLSSLLGLLALGAGCTADDSRRAGSVPITAVEVLPAPQPPPPAVVVAQPEASPLPAAELVPAPAVVPNLSPAAEEVVQLARAQVGQDVILAYIQGVESPFNLDADSIVYLTDLGVESETVTAMVNHDQILRGRTALESVRVDETTPQPGTLATVTEPAATPAEAAPAPPQGTPTTTVSAPATQVTNNYFYNTLSPYGTWVDVPDYGWCWQPTIAVTQADWRPYCHGGRWVWTDCGWYWQSYYSWGWAPFHYGRWHLSSGRGWVWLPDTHWGPAWVTWRSYDGYCGWAPLPPAAHYVSGVGFTYYGRGVSVSFGFGLSSACYSFVPVHHFYTPRPWSHCAPRSTVNKFYGDTTVINNYVVGNNNTIINNGIGTETISRASRTEIRKVRVADSRNDKSTPGIRAERLSRDGSTLMAYRPQLPEQAKRPPATLTERQERAAVRAATVADSQAVSAARLRANTTGRTEATPSIKTPNPPTTTTSRQPAQTPARANSRSNANYSTTERNIPARITERQATTRNDRTESPRTVTPTSPNRMLANPTRNGNETAVTPQRVEAPASRSPNTTTPNPGRPAAPSSPPTPLAPRRSSPTVAIPTPSTPQNSRSTILPAPSNRSPVLDGGRNRPEPITRTPAYTPTPLSPSSRGSLSTPNSATQRTYTPRSAPAPRSTYTPGSNNGTRGRPGANYRSAPAPAPSRSTPAPSYRAPSPAPTPRAAPAPRSAPSPSAGSRGSRTQPN